MRKSLVVKQTEYFYNLMDLNVSGSNVSGRIYKVINNWHQISTALYKLNEFSFVGKSVQDIFDLGASYQSSSEKISIVDSDYNRFLIKFNLLKAKCEAIIDSSSIDDDLSNFYIKLPDNLSDLTKFSLILKDLDISFNKCPIFSEKIGSVTFKKVEEGSSWIVIAIGSVIAGAKALDWIANFVKGCNEIRLQNKTIKNIELDNILKLMEIEDKQKEQEYKRKVEKGEEEKIKSLCIEKFKSIGIECDKINPEDTSRIVHSMKTLADLLDVGVEIYPSPSCDEETKKLFPKQDEFKLLEDSQKLLNEPKEQTND